MRFKKTFKADFFGKKFSTFITSLFVVCLCTVIISQVGLRFKATRTVLTNISQYEGIDASSDASLINKGEIKIEVVDGSADADFEILVNGEKVDVLDTSPKSLDLYSSSVLEIRPSCEDKYAKVTIAYVSDNMKLMCENKDVEIRENIKLINKIKFK